MKCFIAKFHNPHKNSTSVKIYATGPGAVEEGRAQFISHAYDCNFSGRCNGEVIYLRETLASVLETFTGYDRVEDVDAYGAAEFQGLIDLIRERGHAFEVENSDYVDPGVTPVLEYPNGLGYYPAGSMSEFECAVAYFSDDSHTVEIFESLGEAIDSGDADVLDALRDSWEARHPGEFRDALIAAGVIEIEEEGE